MTMPWGSTEEPEVTEIGQQSIPVHVVSSEARPSKSAATEVGRFRTLLISSAVNSQSITPGAQRLINRNLRRHTCHILVNSAGPVVTTSAPSQPAVPATGVAQQNVNAYPVSVAINANGATITNVSVNGVTVGTSAGTYIVPAYGSISIAYSVAVPTWVWSGIPTSGPQPITDGVILGSREEITSGMPATPGTLAGYMQIGDNLRYAVQQELWVAYPSTNAGPVYVTICDQLYSSDPDEYKGYEEIE
jgi:hypothetical protein